MRPATATRKTIPPMVRDWKLSVAPRSRTERKPKIWSSRAMNDFLGADHRERDFAAGEVPVGGQHLPAEAVFSGREAIGMRGQGVGGCRLAEFQRLRGTVRPNQG